MATTINTIKTRILNKYDLISNYTASFVPLKGEICLVEIPAGTSNSGLTPPAVGIKVGDGSHNFNELQWVQAIAGDVSSFVKTIGDNKDFAAKVGTAIGYTGEANIKTLIDGINTNFQNYSTTAQMNTALGKKVDTTTLTAYQNQVTELLAGKVDNGTFTTYQGTVTAALNKKIESSLADKTNAPAANNLLLTEKTIDGKITAASNSLNTTIGALSNLATTEKGSIVAAINEVQGEVSDHAEAIEELQTTVGTGTNGLATKISTLEGEMDEVQGALTGYTSSKTVASAVADAKAAGTTAQTRVGTLGNLKTEAKTSAVVAINEVHDELDTTKASLTTVSGQVETLVGSDTGKSVRQVAAAEVAKITTGADASYDTLKEISDWILNDTTGAADMANDIAELQGLHAKETDGSFKTVAEEAAAAASSAITEANLDQYATNDALNGYKTTVSQTYATKTEVAGTITAASTAVQSVTFAGTAMTKSGTTLSITKDAARSALGYGTMANKDASAYSTTTQMNEAITAAKTELKGNASDASSAETIAGAKKYADNKVSSLNTDLSADIKANTDAIAAMDATIATGTGIIDTITQTNGKITASTRRQIKNADLDTADIFVFYCGNATGYDVNLNTVTIE